MGTRSAERPEAAAKESAAKAPLFLYFTDVTEANLERIAAAESKVEVKRLLAEFMRIDEAEGFRQEILADMHYHNYTFCVSREFAPAKTSTFLSIMKRVLEESVSKRLEAQAAFDVCKKYLLKHGVERPPWSVGVFSFDDVKAIMEYAHNSFFRHYRLYTYAFMTHCNLVFSVDRALNVTLPTARPAHLIAPDQVDEKDQKELAHLFKLPEAEAAMEKLRTQDAPPEDKSTKIKRKVEEGIKEMMGNFEQQLQAQDEQFHKLLESG